MANRQLVFDILANNKASGTIKRVGDDINAQQKSWDNFKRAGTVASAAVLAGVGAMVASSAAAGETMATSNDRIRNINEQMGLFGDTADDVSERLINLANQTARNTGIDQNSIKETQAKLLTFKELAASADEVGGQFDRATQAAIDLAAAGFGDATSNATQLGKALNDPITGITALTRSGVTFTEQEKEQIAAMVEAGDMAGAQEMILAALETQVGGTAEATANGTDKMAVSFSQLQEGIGAGLQPAFQGLLDVGTRVTGWMAEHTGVTQVLMGVVSALAAVVLVAANAEKIHTTWLAITKGATVAWTAVQWLLNAALTANPIGLIIAAIAALVAAVVWAWNNVDWFREGILAAWEWIKNAWQAGSEAVGQWIDNVVNWVKGLWSNIQDFFGRIGDFIYQIWSWSPYGLIINNWDKILDFFRGLPGKMSNAMRGLWDGLKESFRTAVNWVITKWNNFGITLGGGTILGVDIPSVHLDTPNIPLLASGGILTSPRLAVVGEAGDEAVIPLEQGGERLRQILGLDNPDRGIGGQQRMHPDDLRALAAAVSTTLVIDGREIAATVRRHDRRLK